MVQCMGKDERRLPMYLFIIMAMLLQGEAEISNAAEHRDPWLQFAIDVEASTNSMFL